MTEKTIQQFESMKNDYTFGVEVEMNGITRRKAATLAAEILGTNRHKRTAYRHGDMTWSAYDDKGREWKFSRDISIAGPDDEKCELISPVLEYSDIPTLQAILKKLKEAGAVSTPAVGAGVHIHLRRKGGFTVKEVKNLVNVMAAHEEQIGKAINIDSGRTKRYCKVINPNFLNMMHKLKPHSLEELENCWYQGNNADGGRTLHYNSSRYHMLNLHSLFHGHGTVELRLFQFDKGIDCDEIKAYIQLCLGMCVLAHDVKFASPKRQQEENPKYALRCWLLRLGFIGDEFKTSRKILLQNIDGNSAWRKLA